MPARSLDPASLYQDTGISLSFHDSHTGTLKRATYAGEPVRRDPLPAVRNPLIGFGLTTAAALILSFVISVPVLFFPDVALLLFYLPFALFGAGVLAGRTTFLGSIGFIGGSIGGFIGVYIFQVFLVPDGWPLWPLDWEILLTLAFGAACGLGGFASGKLGLRRIERMTENAPKMRRCLKCGAKVGIAARKCWSCRSYLPPT